jgi:hypothetical protein
MVDDQKQAEEELTDEEAGKSETLFTKEIPKMNKAGSIQVGTYRISTKIYNENKFIEIYQKKNSFGGVNTPNYRPEKQAWVTFDPADKRIKEALQEAYKK